MTNAPSTMSDDESAGSASQTFLPAGTPLQEFVVTGVVGEGGFGIVYEATDTLLNRRVAIKEYMPSQLAARAGQRTVQIRSIEFADAFSAGLKSFINEARMLAQFKHSALVEVFRFWEENGTAYMVMPLYEGSTLKDHLAGNPDIPSERWLRTLLTPVLDALDHMHALQVFHRDIAPDNLLILKNGAPLLLDLGAARRVLDNVTQAMTVILKPGYAPIEQYGDDPALHQGAWTDIYALAALVYFAIVRKPPPAAVARLIRDPFKPLAQMGLPGFSANFLTTIDQALAVRPEDRPQSIEAFRAGLGLNASTTAAVTVKPSGYASNTAPVGKPRPATGLQTPPADFQDIDKTVPMLAAAVATAREYSVDPTDHGLAAAPLPVGIDKSELIKSNEGVSRQTAQSGLAASSDPRTRSQDNFASRSRTRVIVGVACLALAAGGVAWWSSHSSPPQIKREPISGTTGEPTLASNPTAGTPKVASPSLDTTPATTGASTGASTGSAPVPATTVLPGTATVPTTSSDPGSGNAAASRETPSGNAAPAPAAEQRGLLRLSARPWAEVFVNGTQRGTSPPLKRLSLPPGTYQVELRNPAGPSFSRQIEIKHNQSVDLDHQF